jgi:hypothetical protein
VTAQIISFGAARTASILRENAPPSWIALFLTRMTRAAREQPDAGREAFWRDVACLLGCAPPTR